MENFDLDDLLVRNPELDEAALKERKKKIEEERAGRRERTHQQPASPFGHRRQTGNWKESVDPEHRVHYKRA